MIMVSKEGISYEQTNTKQTRIYQGLIKDLNKMS